MNKAGHKCLYCFTWTSRQHLCEWCWSKHAKTGCFENLLREWGANRSWSTPMAYTPYLGAVRDIVRDIPVSNKRKKEFYSAMATAYRKELDK